MLRMVVPFVCGVLLSWVFQPPLSWLAPLLGIMTVAALLLLLLPTDAEERWQRGAVFSCWFLAVGLCWALVRLAVNDPLAVEADRVSDGPWMLRVEAVNSVSPKVVRMDASLVARMDRRVCTPVHGNVMLTFLRDSLRVDPRAGDRVLMDAVLEPIVRVADPGGFDRKAWAKSRGIALEAFATRDQWQVLDHPWRWTDLFTDAREQVSRWLDGSGVPFRERALVKALVLGERDELDYEQKDAFMRSGTIHVLAVSGMHVGLIFIVLSFATQWWGKSGPAQWVRGLVILAALWGYAGLTGASPSVLRATVMFTLFTLASMARQRTDHLNSLFAAALILLVWDPSMLHQASFQLSFLAVLGIILFYRPLRSLWVPDNWILQQAWALAVVSTSAQLLTTPLSLYLFKAFPVWFLPANILVVSASTFAVYGGVLLALFHWVPVVGDVLAWLMTQLLRLVGWSTDLFASLPGAYPAVRIGAREMVLLYLLVLAASAWWQWRWKSMKWVTSACVAALLVCWGLRAREANHRSSFVVYEERDGFVAAMVTGRELAVASSGDSSLVRPRTLSKLQKHQRAFGLERVVPVGEDVFGAGVSQHGGTLAGGGRWRSSTFDVLFTNTGTGLGFADTSARFDAVVLHDRYSLAADELEAWRRVSRCVVIAGGVPWRTRGFIRTWCAEHDLACHDVREQGAFILQR